jgi:lipopolysaccharide/colanic/teichoic acid biosynthesis glycosyltransferase
LEILHGVPLLGISELPLDQLQNRLLKRVTDIFGSLVGLLLSAPAIFACGLLIYLESPGPIFFSQERVGRNGTRFKMFKIRTMRVGAERTDHVNQSTLRDDPRLLRTGKWMRRWNLDETPQFWNVLNGDMSLVGPRPERTVHSNKLSNEIPHYNARYVCKPGMTGWAQVNGYRGDTSLVERVRFDLFYLENWTARLDFQIMFQTFLRYENAS